MFRSPRRTCNRARSFSGEMRTTAALGERDLAVTLLRRAFAKGVSYSSALHRQPDLRLLQGYAPFEELLRPKG